MEIQAKVFWLVMLCSLVKSLHPEDGGSMVLQNIGILSQDYTASEFRRP